MSHRITSAQLLDPDLGPKLWAKFLAYFRKETYVGLDGETRHVLEPELSLDPGLLPLSRTDAAREMAKAEAKDEDGEQVVIDWFVNRRLALDAAVMDPFNHGHVWQTWKDAKRLIQDNLALVLFGGGGSAKTWFMAWYAVKQMIERPGSQVLFLSESELSSNLTIQAAVWHYLPLNVKGLKPTRQSKLNYKKGSGFGDNTFTLPPPYNSIGVFGFYTQDVGHHEGPGWDLILADENMPLNWFRTLLYRLPRRGGKLIWGYTPIHGITPTIRHVTNGAEYRETRRAELLPMDQVHVEGCPPGHMPYIGQSALPRTAIMWFFTKDNPYSGYSQQVEQTRGASAVELERRFYGFARNTVACQFPLFGSANIIPADRLPSDLARYMVLDPAGTRNFFLLWLGVDPKGYHYIYREWPRFDVEGAWADPSEDTRHFDGVPGPAQPNLGYGILDYKRLILELEGNKFQDHQGWELCGETIIERLIDSRSGSQETVAEKSGGMSMIDRFQEPQFQDQVEVGPPMAFTPAPGLKEEFTQINQLLRFDRSQPMTALINEPRLYVVDTCKNVIWALQNYTAHDGEHAACKDPIDCLRYACDRKIEWVPAGALDVMPGGVW